MEFSELFFGTIAFLTSFVGLIPQIIKSLQTRSTKDLSMVMLINYLICSCAWIVYGWIVDSQFVIASNVVGLATCLILMTQKRRYDAETPT